MTKDELLKNCLTRYCETIKHSFQNCENGSKILIKIDKGSLRAHNSLVVQGIVGTVLSQLVTNMIAQAGGLIGKLLASNDIDDVVEIEVFKVDDVTSSRCNILGDTITDHVSDDECTEEESGKMSIQRYDREKGRVIDSEEPETNSLAAIETILDKHNLSHMKEYLDDPVFLSEFLTERQKQTPHEDIQWVLNNL